MLASAAAWQERRAPWRAAAGGLRRSERRPRRAGRRQSGRCSSTSPLSRAAATRRAPPSTKKPFAKRWTNWRGGADQGTSATEDSRGAEHQWRQRAVRLLCRWRSRGNSAPAAAGSPRWHGSHWPLAGKPRQASRRRLDVKVHLCPPGTQQAALADQQGLPAGSRRQARPIARAEKRRMTPFLSAGKDAASFWASRAIAPSLQSAGLLPVRRSADRRRRICFGTTHYPRLSRQTESAELGLFLPRSTQELFSSSGAPFGGRFGHEAGEVCWRRCTSRRRTSGAVRRCGRCAPAPVD